MQTSGSAHLRRAANGEDVESVKKELINLILDVCPPLLTCPRSQLASTLTSKEGSAVLRKFVADPHIRTLVVGKEIEAARKDEAKDEIDSVVVNTFVSTDIDRHAVSNAALAFVKRSNMNLVHESADEEEGQRAADTGGVGSKLQIINIGWAMNVTEESGGTAQVQADTRTISPFDILKNYLQCVADPVFAAHQVSTGGTTEAAGAAVGEEEATVANLRSIAAARKKLTEFIVCVQQAQQTIEVPLIQLVVDPTIRDYVAKCRAAGKKFTPEEFLEEYPDPSVLSQLQAGVHKWMKETQRVTRIDRDPTTGTTAEEISFWVGMERALNHIEQQLQTPEVEATLAVLKYAKRFLAAVPFETDTGLKSKLEAVSNVNILMRDFPLNDLLAANTISHLTAAIRLIFNHMKRLKSVNHYPFPRAYRLVEALSRDLNAQLLKILGAHRLLSISFEEFEHIVSNFRELSRVWDEEVRRFKDFIREQIKKRGILSALLPKLTCEHIALNERVEDIRRVRKQHQKFLEVVREVMPSERRGDSSATREIASAFNVFQLIEPLDVSREGQDNWESAKKQYNDKVDRVESQITNKLRDRLGAAKTGAEMFRVFSQFNPLFFRPRIRGAIQEYQASLIQQVKDDLKALQLKHNEGYDSSQCATATTILDIPRICGVIIWSKQLERRLKEDIRRAEDVLGRGWEQHTEGQNLKQSAEELANKLDSQAIFDAWLHEAKETKPLDVSSRIFGIKKHGGKGYELVVRYDPRVMFLFKEVRCLTAMGIRVPYSVKAGADDARWIYPYLMTLQESIRTYTFTCNRLNGPKFSTIAPLVARYQLEVQQCLEENTGLRWDYEKLNVFTTNLCNKVYMLESKLEDVEGQVARIDELIENFRTAELTVDGASFREIIRGIQDIVTDIVLANYSNLETYVKLIDERLEEVLIKRLEELVTTWVTEFASWPQAGTVLIDHGSLHEFKMQNQQLYLSPPLEAARQNWTSEFHKALGTLCGLPRLSVVDTSTGTTRENAGFQQKRDTTFRYLIEKISPETLSKAYQCIRDVLEALNECVGDWLKYQYLWDIEVASITATLGDDVEAWKHLLNEIRASKSTLDTSEERNSFGPIVVDYSTAQSKVLMKFESCHREIINVFGTKVFDQVSQFHRQLRQACEELESQAESGKLNFLSGQAGATDAEKAEITARMTQFVLRLQTARKNESRWATLLDHYSQSEKLLERQRYAFPTNWIWMDGVVGDWESFQQLLRHQSSLLERHRHQLQYMVLEHDRRMQESLTQLYADWSRTRPIHGETQPHYALQAVNRMEAKLSALREHYDKVTKAKEALEMDAGDRMTPGPAGGLTPEALEEELEGLKGVWTELKSLHASLDALREIPWSAVVPKKVRQGLTDLLASTKKIPAKFRQYEAFEHLQHQINDYLKLNMLLTQMRTDALKERHWKKLLETLQLRANLNELTLGHLWAADLHSHEAVIRDILTQAQGELALEEFLRMLRDSWMEYELDLVVYKNRCKLIRGWDDLFSLLDEHLNSLQSMKTSPYYKIFEEETNYWDEKLNRLRVLMDSWMVVQRRWVYLEGVFTGSADIQALLPNEFARFRSIDNDFLAIMKKTAARPKVMDVAATEGLQRSLDRLSDLLSKIQKALGEYLERQRLEFPRFYFVGDEDLLEMIGNSKDVKIVRRHLNKMFGGITNLITAEDTADEIIAIGSKEGEVVPLKTPIRIPDYTSLNTWLRACEKAMFSTMAELLTEAVIGIQALSGSTELPAADFFQWMAKFPMQIVMLGVQIDWTSQCEAGLRQGTTGLTRVLSRCERLLEALADQVLVEVDKLQRVKIVQLITELVHQRDVCRGLLAINAASDKDFAWLQYMRLYWDPKQSDPTQRLTIRMANAEFIYGFEYLGISEKLVQTPLTDKCYLTLTQALHLRLGGNPFGPAGTGKTETVKALGSQLGRFVLVFCCDETFDFQAMGRIFVGLCQVGAWGCFDEFNRLEERILSACSEQILTIQTGLKSNKTEIELLNKIVRLNSSMGIFVTMNPGYAGRSNLPDNLKQLFREFAMIYPDTVQIAQVLLFSQGFRSAEHLSGKVVALFELCSQQLSHQSHYDFGLRSLKSVLSSAGNLKRQSLAEQRITGHTEAAPEELTRLEKDILLRSICDTVVPKLVAADVPLLRSLLHGVFPGADLLPIEEAALETEVRRLCQLNHYECRPSWLSKVLQLYQIQRLHHGIMLVGSVGTGKSSAWRILLESIEQLDGIRGYSYVLDAKSVPKEQLYGRLDPTTLEWTDGMFTALLRKILYNTHGGTQRRHWIVFDGDVDPDWAENLNSVLDDNKLLTLPNGERLQIPSNLRILFEVDDLKSTTLATVSRCGMVWFSEDVLTEDAISMHFLNNIRHRQSEDHHLQAQLPAGPGGAPILAMGSIRHRVSFEESALIGVSKSFDEAREPPPLGEEELQFHGGQRRLTQPVQGGSEEIEKRIGREAADILQPFFEPDGLVSKCLQHAAEANHIMEFTKMRVLESTFSLIRKLVSQVVEFNQLRSEFPMPKTQLEKVMTKGLLFSLVWGCGGSMTLADRTAFSHRVALLATQVALPSNLDSETTLLDYEVRIEDGEWHHWRERVVSVEVEPHQVRDASIVIETIDTIRHRHVLAAWLEEKKPFILCGPPGSGKTMTLTSTLKGLADFEIAFLNFSSGTTPEVLLKTFEHYCEYVKTTAGVVLRPTQPGKWLIIFADEINLPAPDKFNTQCVIMLMRQMQEYSGFWKLTDPVAGQWSWIRMERIQFAGACNPPTDAGRHPLSNRFLRHAPIIFVDFPGQESLKQIYGTLNRALLRRIPSLRPHAENLTNAMVEFYVASQKNFTVDQQPHYIYSPRELTRWKVALNEALSQRDHMNLSELVRLFIHEGLRIFQDRLTEASEREWTDDTINSIAMKQFPGIDAKTLQRPILYCCYLTKNYEEVQREELRELIQGKLRVFNEEELNVQLVLFDQVLDHITRIDRVLRQPLGHLLLVGASGAGKTVLSKFVSWLNGLSIFQIKAGRNYDTLAFESDLRTVMKRAGLKDERITFIFDESNALGPAFLERMNALLASGEVPGLFEGDEYVALMSEAKQAYGADTGIDDQDLFAHFTKLVQRNLHIVFTMNPANPDFSNRQATSPALFNRCVIDWFGDWPHDALIQVAREFTQPLELEAGGFSDARMDVAQRHMALADVIVLIHESVVALNQRLAQSGKKHNYLSPRDFLDFIRHFTSLVEEKKGETVETTKHLNVGLAKLKETEQQVAELNESLAVKGVELEEKNRQAEEKMQLMVEQQAVAEERKKAAEGIAADLDKQAGLIEKRKLEVQQQLHEVEPLLREAEAAVSNIPKRTLDELRALTNPPAPVKIAVEAVVVMLSNLGTKEINWDDARKVLKGGEFISRVLAFDCMSTSAATVQRIKQKYIDTEGWDSEKIMRASKAAGPLALWVESSINFQMIVQKVEPLRKEIRELEEERVINQQSLQTTQAQIAALEEKLQVYKTEYAQLISDVQMIKQEMQAVQHKVKRSSELLKNLASEKVRWSTASAASKEQLVTAIGDCLLAGAFATYVGFFDHGDRAKLIREWQELLAEFNIKFLHDLSLVEYLSKPSERYNWIGHALPSDELSIENAIILRRHIRYPLIIDPSGQAATFLKNMYADRKIVKTSFIDSSFFKNLESSLRFGTPLLVQDVERVDPILNSVLNQETHKAGGRVLITVGDSDIDFSPMFTMFLTTRDPTAEFTPDLCSRVTFVNFTLTPSSLLNQCLNLALKSERPDVDKKRSDVLKLQGEFVIRIRELEDALLLALSNVKGNILDDDNVITTLESLKAQAADVAEQAARADEVMAEVEKASDVYQPLAASAARLYFTLQSMQCLKFFYHYDLLFFESVYHETLRDTASLSDLPPGDYTGRLKVLFNLLFHNVFARCAVGLMYEDRIVFALQVARIKFESEFDIQLGGRDLSVLLQGDVATQHSETDVTMGADDKAFPKTTPLETLLTVDQRKALQVISTLPALNSILTHIDQKPKAWKNFLQSAQPEAEVPPDCIEWTSHDATEEAAFETADEAQRLLRKTAKTLIREALIVKALRPDRLLMSLTRLVEAICGHGFMQIPEVSQEDLHRIVTTRIRSTVPVLLVASPGFDPSSKVAWAAKRQNQHLTSIAIGSEEGYATAEKAVTTAARQGTWVLLKNVHLSATWLHELEKRLFRMTLHDTFRLFLTMELSEKVPRNLFRVSFVLLFEPPAGLRASMQRTYDQFLLPHRTDRNPVVARSRLHFLLAYLHAVILERKRYTPFGWSKEYEFSDADQHCALDVVDQWLDSVASGSFGPISHPDVLPDTLDPVKIPFEAIRSLLKNTVYGGRLDNEVDARVLASFVDHIFRPEAFESDFPLSHGYTGDNNTIPPLIAPDLLRSKEQYLEYIDKMRSVDEPLWVGLPFRADRLISGRQGFAALTKWYTLHSKSAEDLHELLPAALMPRTKSTRIGSRSREISRSLTLGQAPGLEGWVAHVHPKVVTLFGLLPSGLQVLERSEQMIHDPMFRCFDREVTAATRLLERIRSDLSQLKDICEGAAKFTNYTRDLARSISRGIPHPEWQTAYRTPANMSLGEWIIDFCQRVAQLAFVGVEFGAGTTDVGDPQIIKYQDGVQRILGPGCPPPSQHVVWFGGLQFPKAFLTATRQCVAQTLRRSLDDLRLELQIGAPLTSDEDFLIGGIILENASWDAERKVLTLTESLSTTLPPILLRWVPREAAASQQNGQTIAKLPMFLTTTRGELVAMVDLPVASEAGEGVWYQRGVALILWHQS